MRDWEFDGRPIVLAHRAGALEAPENSREAFALMDELGHKYIETDVHATSDGQLVILHDPILDRTTSGSGFVNNASWDEISNLEDESGQAPMRLIDALEEFPDLCFNVDIKTNSAADPAIELFSDGRYKDRVLLASFSEKRMRKLRRALPQMSTSLGTAAIGKLVVASKSTKSLRKQILRSVPGPRQNVVCAQIPMAFKLIGVFTEDFVDVCEEHGLYVHVWTINEVFDMSNVLNKGGHGIITDAPSLAQELIDSRYPPEGNDTH